MCRWRVHVLGTSLSGLSFCAMLSAFIERGAWGRLEYLFQHADPKVACSVNCLALRMLACFLDNGRAATKSDTPRALQTLLNQHVRGAATLDERAPVMLITTPNTHTRLNNTFEAETDTITASGNILSSNSHIPDDLAYSIVVTLELHVAPSSRKRGRISDTRSITDITHSLPIRRKYSHVESVVLGLLTCIPGSTDGAPAPELNAILSLLVEQPSAWGVITGEGVLSALVRQARSSPTPLVFESLAALVNRTLMTNDKTRAVERILRSELLSAASEGMAEIHMGEGDASFENGVLSMSRWRRGDLGNAILQAWKVGQEEDILAEIVGKAKTTDGTIPKITILSEDSPIMVSAGEDEGVFSTLFSIHRIFNYS
ncbi:hypothetical protein BOTBODRAFT_42576 [Botryobasidium botryosum FD-172 SS1]|uniref:Uncharacterized protein n=1 Tax=Botryobasidium botryosum (strain FD-172 SS1) TaxID=930990 RepID=A0A067MR02_BOTB1|nr:hypothetical protein BOTBODRAFT_42576 [Botryobasidium botryosum FD-172 SS1]